MLSSLKETVTNFGNILRYDKNKLEIALSEVHRSLLKRIILFQQVYNIPICPRNQAFFQIFLQ